MDESLWLDINRLTTLLGRSKSHVQQHIVQHLPADCIRSVSDNPNVGKQYYAPAAVKFFIDRAEKKGEKQQDSINHQLKLVELGNRQIDLEERKKTIVAVAKVMDLFLVISKMLRRCGETLQRIYGKDAGKLLDETLVAAGKMLEDELAKKFNGSSQYTGDPMGRRERLPADAGVDS